MSLNPINPQTFYTKKAIEDHIENTSIYSMVKQFNDLEAKKQEKVKESCCFKFKQWFSNFFQKKRDC